MQILMGPSSYIFHTHLKARYLRFSYCQRLSAASTVILHWNLMALQLYDFMWIESNHSNIRLPFSIGGKGYSLRTCSICSELPRLTIRATKASKISPSKELQHRYICHTLWSIWKLWSVVSLRILSYKYEYL